MFGRQYGFQKGLSPAIALVYIDAIVRVGNNKIETLDLAKAYYKVSRQILLKYYRKVMRKQTMDMLPVCLQSLTMSTKGYILGKQATIRHVLTQVAPLSPILFLVNI